MLRVRGEEHKMFKLFKWIFAFIFPMIAIPLTVIRDWKNKDFRG